MSLEGMDIASETDIVSNHSNLACDTDENATTWTASEDAATDSNADF